MLVSHRGYARSGVAENTIAAFDAAFRAGADAIETDVRMTKDGYPIIAHSDRINCSSGGIMRVGKITTDAFLRERGDGAERILTLPELFGYIENRKDPFFIELKESNPALADSVVRFIAERDAWEQVHVIGFNRRIRRALALQRDHPRLRVAQLFVFPPLSSFCKPVESWGAFTGWLEAKPLTEPIFRMLYSASRLTKLRERYDRMGFRVMGGVANDEMGIRLFLDAGINDIFTDEVPLAAHIIRSVN